MPSHHHVPAPIHIDRMGPTPAVRRAVVALAPQESPRPVIFADQPVVALAKVRPILTPRHHHVGARIHRHRVGPIIAIRWVVIALRPQQLPLPCVLADQPVEALLEISPLLTPRHHDIPARIHRHRTGPIPAVRRAVVALAPHQLSLARVLADQPVGPLGEVRPILTPRHHHVGARIHRHRIGPIIAIGRAVMTLAPQQLPRTCIFTDEPVETLVEIRPLLTPHHNQISTRVHRHRIDPIIAVRRTVITLAPQQLPRTCILPDQPVEPLTKVRPVLTPRHDHISTCIDRRRTGPIPAVRRTVITLAPPQLPRTCILLDQPVEPLTETKLILPPHHHHIPARVHRHPIGAVPAVRRAVVTLAPQQSTLAGILANQPVVTLAEVKPVLMPRHDHVAFRVHRHRAGAIPAVRRAVVRGRPGELRRAGFLGNTSSSKQHSSKEDA